ncbi:MAG TPA: 30S ribosomal protein S1, partial [Desulfobacter postgatei]|nr:30S ribosomal protein S1 [Desulfobacter postgatei]
MNNNIAEENQNMNQELETQNEVKESELELTGEETMEELLDIYDSSLSKFEEGQVVTGTVISVGRERVLVDVGYKSA